MKALVLAMGGLLVVGLGVGVNAQPSSSTETAALCGKQWPVEAKIIQCSLRRGGAAVCLEVGLWLRWKGVSACSVYQPLGYSNDQKQAA